MENFLIFIPQENILRFATGSDSIQARGPMLRASSLAGLIFKIAVTIFFAFIPFGTLAKTTPLEISGWIPYWRVATGTADVILHIDAFKEVSPFGYTVKSDGTLFDAMHVEDSHWQTLFAVARENKVKTIPTVMWANGATIDAILRSPKKRKAHIAEIVKAVNDNGFDGIDIDYEGKQAKTKQYFSLFLRDLYKAMGKKLVVCSIEARTPLDSRFSIIPKNIEFANDFVAINKYCDRVRIMAYDQGKIDLTLNKTAEDFYIPVADPRWVKKVIALAAKTIAKKKIIIGVPTYGYEYEVSPTRLGFSYDLLWTFNPKYALDLANELHITPERNSAGELSFHYVSTSTAPEQVSRDNILSNNATLPATTSEAISSQISPTVFPTVASSSRIVWWSDAGAIQDKILLAKKLGVRGIALFKLDGGEDPKIWDILR